MADRAPRSLVVRLLALAGALAVFAGLITLGTWQVHRLAWKEALIALVDARLRAPPTPPPGPGDWPSITAEADEYRRVVLQGRFLSGCTPRVQALTERGAGTWALVPFRTAANVTILVNRGFVPLETPTPAPPSGPTTVTGLLRLSEPGGRFLAPNDPAANRWNSRDVAAIAAWRRLAPPVAPYFVDADAGPDPAALPVGGLTVVAFPNNHLAYAITWYTMAAVLAGAVVVAIRQERRRP